MKISIIKSFKQTENYNRYYTNNKWSAILPIGVIAKIFDGFSLLVGTDLRFDLVEINEFGTILYPEIITRKTINDDLVYENIQINRGETYESQKPIAFSKSSNINIGAFYEHSSGLNLFVKSNGDIFNNNYWTFGIEYNY